MPTDKSIAQAFRYFDRTWRSDSVGGRVLAKIHAKAAELGAQPRGEGECADLERYAKTVYAKVPDLPVTAETCEQATDALHEFCLLFGHLIRDDDTARSGDAMGGGG